MASAAFETVALVEVAMRNSIDDALSAHFQESQRRIPWFLGNPPMDQSAMVKVNEVRNRLRSQRKDSRDQIVAGLSFGFWSGMLNAKYEDLWRAAIRRAFPYSDGTRKQVANQLDAVRKFRNRLAHHDSMLNLDIPFEMRRVRRLAEFIHPELAEWISSVDRTDALYAERPEAQLDTVVVPGRLAWPLYEEQSAYVCQTGRWFQPVERIAFYADQEIKADIPLILHHRDDVEWTDHNVDLLSRSGNRNDKQIANVIEASQRRDWHAGTYQVFLLTRPGDSRHRTLPGPLAHETSGRGSAYVQRQRYVTLHALETAATTADLL